MKRDEERWRERGIEIRGGRETITEEGRGRHRKIGGERGKKNDKEEERVRERGFIKKSEVEWECKRYQQILRNSKVDGQEEAKENNGK